jgi:6-phosphofructokinase 2
VPAAPEWEACLARNDGLDPFPRHVVGSGSLPPGVPNDFYVRLSALAERRGARLLLDASGEALRAALAGGVFLVKPSLAEFQGLTGLCGAEETQLLRECSRLVGEGRCEVIVLSLGGAGALMVTSRERQRFVAPTVPVRSTVGAGDSMLAGIAMRLDAGESVREAVRFGVAAAAASVMNPGTELCRCEDVQRLLPRVTSVRV